jgi:hypothetical protein
MWKKDMGKKLRHRGRRNAYDLKEILHQLKKECMKEKRHPKWNKIALDWEGGVRGASTRRKIVSE